MVSGLAIVLVVVSTIVLSLISALQVQVPREMPFGVVGDDTTIIDAVESEGIGSNDISFDLKTYSDKAAALEAINQGDIYGAYVAGGDEDTLITVPAKSFFAEVELVPAFEAASKQLGGQIEVQQVKPLPERDRVGAVVGLLLVPTIICGLVLGILTSKLTGSAAARWRGLILLGYSIAGALVTDLIAGPLIGAYGSEHFFSLWPCFAIVILAMALATSALEAVLKQLGVILAFILLLIVGVAGAGSSGTALLPTFWQSVGAVFPPRLAADLFRNVIYFDGNSISTPLIGLGGYVLIGAAVISVLAWVWQPRSARRASDSPAADGQPGPSGSRDPSPTGPSRSRLIVIALLLTAIYQVLFSMNYMSSGHSPVANKMPFGVTGPSKITDAATQGISLDIKSYPDEAALKTAINRNEIWGGLVPGAAASKLIVVPSASDIAPLDLTVNFERAAEAEKEQIEVTSYEPRALAPNDPFGIVPALLITPILFAGYMAATMLRTATGVSTARYRGLVLLGYALVASLIFSILAGPVLSGFPTEKFWIVWGILALVILVIALIASVLGRLLGAFGAMVTVFIVICFGVPGDGGGNGVYYLPDFWNAIGPFLPPRNALALLHDSIYFEGNGTLDNLLILVAYAVVFGVIITVFNRSGKVAPETPITTETEAAVAGAAAGAGAAV